MAARACAPLPVLAEYALPLLAVAGRSWLEGADDRGRRGGAPWAAALGRLGGELGPDPAPPTRVAGRPPLRHRRKRANPGALPAAARESPAAGRSDSRGIGILGSRMRLAVLSDIHANLAALEAVREDLPEVDEVWVLGDIVGYGPQPNEVIAALQEMGARSVMGNHDGAAIGTVDASYFNPDARRRSSGPAR